MSAAETLEALCPITMLYPEQWAAVHNNLANTYVELGDSLSVTWQDYDRQTALRSAEGAYQVSLMPRVLEGHTSEWAMIQHNLGRVYLQLGEFEASVAAYDRALTVRTRVGEPLRWAMTKHNLAAALLGWGSTNDDLARLDLAERAAKDALSERRRDRSPMEWAMTTMILGNIALIRFDILRDARELDRAEGLVRDAFEPFKSFQAERHLEQSKRLLDMISLRRQRSSSP